jgi:hypothetical protein
MFASCSINTLKNSKIKEFESYVGEEITRTLDFSVLVLDTLLQEYYLNSGNHPDSLYLDFTKKTIHEQVEWRCFFKNKKRIEDYYDRVKNSGLRAELFLNYKGFTLKKDFIDDTPVNYPDTSGIKVIQINYEYKSKESSRALPSSRMWLLSESEKGNIDSVVLSVQNQIELNMHNRYYKGLELVSKRNSIVNEYLLNRKQYHGRVLPSTILKGWENLKMDYNDYFFKRIVATEILLLSDINKLESD